MRIITANSVCGKWPMLFSYARDGDCFANVADKIDPAYKQAMYIKNCSTTAGL